MVWREINNKIITISFIYVCFLKKINIKRSIPILLLQLKIFSAGWLVGKLQKTVDWILFFLMLITVRDSFLDLKNHVRR